MDPYAAAGARRLSLFLGGLGAIAKSFGRRGALAARLTHGFAGALADPLPLPVDIDVKAVFSCHQ